VSINPCGMKERADVNLARSGSFLMSRLANYFPERFISFAFLDVAYQAPSGPFSVEAINEITEKTCGYPIFGYWYFFNDPDAADMMNRDVSSSLTVPLENIVHHRPPSLSGLLYLANGCTQQRPNARTL